MLLAYFTVASGKIQQLQSAWLNNGKNSDYDLLLEELYKKYKREVDVEISYSYSDPEQIQELSSEIFSKIVEKIYKREKVKDFNAYIRTVVKNTLIKSFKSNQKEVNIIQPLIEDIAVNEEIFSLNEINENNSFINSVEIYLFAHLKTDLEREVFTQIYYDSSKKSAREMGLEFGVSQSKIENIKKKICRILKKSLGEL